MTEKISKSKIKQFAHLAHKKYRAELGMFLAEGNKCVLELLPKFDIHAIVATKDWYECHAKELVNIKVLEADRTQLQQISSLSTATQVIAICNIPAQAIEEESIESGLTLLLDGVRDPGNLGTIIRVADWFGIRKIFASKDTVDVYNPKTIQATMGSISRVNVAYTDLGNLICTHRDIPVFGTILEGNNIYTTKLSENAFIVMGNEGVGISTEIRSLITSPIKIPSYPGDVPTAESLNVGTATAITLAEFRRRQITP